MCRLFCQRGKISTSVTKALKLCDKKFFILLDKNSWVFSHENFLVCSPQSSNPNF